MIGKLESVVVLLAVALGGLALWYAWKKAPAAVAAVGDAINPLNADNLAATVANKTTQAITGDPNQTFGGWVYDVTHPDPVKQLNTASGNPSGMSFEDLNYLFPIGANFTDAVAGPDAQGIITGVNGAAFGLYPRP